MVKGEPSVNLKGKPKGCRDRATLLKISLAAMEAAHPEGAEGWLKQQAKERPVAYLQYVGKILPRDSTVHQDQSPESQFSDIISKLEEATKIAENAQNSAQEARSEAKAAQEAAGKAEALAQANRLLANRQAKGMEEGAHKSLSSKGPAQPQEVK